MLARFIIYPLNHTILVVDISEIGLPKDVYPTEGELKMVPSIQFQSWRFAEAYFLKKGANVEVLNKVSESVTKGSIAALTIPER
jgi:hypothetical protein